MTYGPSNSLTAFLNTSVVFSEDESQRLYELTILATTLANYINVRDISLYTTNEIINGQQFSDPNDNNTPKFAYRKIFYIGSIASGATLVVPHEIDQFTQFTRIYGTITTDVVDYRPIPRVSATLITDQVSLDADATNFTIVNGATAPNITSGIVVLEYLKT